MINVQHVHKVYQDGEVHALRGIDLTVQPGEMIAVMGPSGCGKSTLLNIVGSLDIPSKGNVEVFGHRIGQGLNTVQFRSHVVGFIFQSHNLFPTLTAAENVELALYEHGLTKQNRRARALEVLETVGLQDQAARLPRHLSGGQRQRVAIARALAARPKLVLADEPTGALDSVTRDEVMALLRRYNQQAGTTFLIVTHDPEVSASCDRTVRLRDGVVVG